MSNIRVLRLTHGVNNHSKNYDRKQICANLAAIFDTKTGKWMTVTTQAKFHHLLSKYAKNECCQTVQGCIKLSGSATKLFTAFAVAIVCCDHQKLIT